MAALRRLADWLVDAWKREHNQLHHYRLGEVDPDVVELNTHLQSLPRPLRAVAALFLASIWKPTYYAPSNQRELRYQREGGKGARPRTDGVDLDQINPLAPLGREVWLQSWIPYVLWAFVALPALFLLISPQAALIALGTSLAELLTSLHTFAIVVTNHAGGYRSRRSNRGDYVGQITGSVNPDGRMPMTAHGWLNYQIEHHVWPDLSMRGTRGPPPQALCEQTAAHLQSPPAGARRAGALETAQPGAGSRPRPALRGGRLAPAEPLRRRRLRAWAPRPAARGPRRERGGPPMSILAVGAWVALMLCGLGNTVGYHRLLTHQAFKTGQGVRPFFPGARRPRAALRWSVGLHHFHHLSPTTRGPTTHRRGAVGALWVAAGLEPGPAPCTPSRAGQAVVVHDVRRSRTNPPTGASSARTCARAAHTDLDTQGRTLLFVAQLAAAWAAGGWWGIAWLWASSPTPRGR